MSDRDRTPGEPMPDDDVEAHSSTGWDLSVLLELRDTPPDDDLAPSEPDELRADGE